MKVRKRIAIVGGGTAGWLAALVLSSEKSRPNGEPAPDITLIESSKIPTIGVGEGTTAIFRQLLLSLGIDERKFLCETGATIKYGIRHKDWRKLGHHYDGPIDDIEAVSGQAISLYCLNKGVQAAKPHLFSKLMERSHAPFAMIEGKELAAGPYHFAYHFDQAKAGRFLRDQAKDVSNIDDTVLGVVKDTASGNVTALKLESGSEFEADIFLDCTGFKRTVIGALGAKWVSYAAELPVNRAMPFWIDLDEQEEITPYTTAWAQKSGWMWQIPTYDRYGCGYVYSDHHCSADEAQAEIESVLKKKIQPRADIKIEAGRLEESWIKNCIALGLSSSFLEPLEATSLHATIVQLSWLSHWIFNTEKSSAYNHAVAQQVDDFKDFIRLHYVTERDDSAFWFDVKRAQSQELTQKLEKWRSRFPLESDFPALPGNPPHVQRQLHIPVLDGLGLLSREAARAVLRQNPKQRSALRRAYDQLTKEHTLAASKCTPHRAWLQSLH